MERRLILASRVSLKRASLGVAVALLCASVVLQWPPAAAQDQGPILLPQPKPQPKASPTLLVVCDLACDWKLDGQAKGRLDSGGSAKVVVGLGQHMVVATTTDGLDQVKQFPEVKSVGQVLVNIELQPVRDTRLKAEQQARDQAAQEAQARADTNVEQQQNSAKLRHASDQQALSSEQDRMRRNSIPKRGADTASNTVSIKDPAEYNAYQNAVAIADPQAKATAFENFLTSYPQSAVRHTILDQSMDLYQSLGDTAREEAAASQLLAVDPDNVKAILISVDFKKGECQKGADTTPCGEAASLAQRGLSVQRPAGQYSDADWQKVMEGAYPIFHSAIALDDYQAKKDYASAIGEYRLELMLYPPASTTSGPGLVDTLMLAQAYSKSDPPDMVQAVWFYARAWSFAPPAYKPQVAPLLEYWYQRYHGSLDGLDQVKSLAGVPENVFPPPSYQLTPVNQ